MHYRGGQCRGKVICIAGVDSAEERSICIAGVVSAVKNTLCIAGGWTGLEKYTLLSGGMHTLHSAVKRTLSFAEG